jgi:hypothetical protein
VVTPCSRSIFEAPAQTRHLRFPNGSVATENALSIVKGINRILFRPLYYVINYCFTSCKIILLCLIKTSFTIFLYFEISFQSVPFQGGVKHNGTSNQQYFAACNEQLIIRHEHSLPFELVITSHSITQFNSSCLNDAHLLQIRR